MRAVLSCWSLNCVLALSLGAYYILENKRRDRAFAATPSQVIEAMSVENEEFFDRTDMEDYLKFRYRW